MSPSGQAFRTAGAERRSSTPLAGTLAVKPFTIVSSTTTWPPRARTRSSASEVCGRRSRTITVRSVWGLDRASLRSAALARSLGRITLIGARTVPTTVRARMAVIRAGPVRQPALLADGMGDDFGMRGPPPGRTLTLGGQVFPRRGDGRIG